MAAPTRDGGRDSSTIVWLKYSRVRKLARDLSVGDRAVFSKLKPSGTQEIIRWLMTWEATGLSFWPRGLSFGRFAGWIRM